MPTNGNLEEIDKLEEIYNLPRINHEELENWNRSIVRKEIESVIKNPSTKKGTGPDDFTSESYQTEELTSIYLKLLQEKVNNTRWNYKT